MSPTAPGIGLLAQFILLPAFTFLLTLILKPHPSMALGMILVAACALLDMNEVRPAPAFYERRMVSKFKAELER